MNELKIEYNRKKRIKILFLGLAILIVSIIMLYFMIFEDSKIKIFYIAMILLVTGTSIYFIISGIKNIFNKDNTGLILNSEGFYFKGTENARKIGFVNWKDVESTATMKVYKTDQIGLKLLNCEKYIQNLNNVSKEFTLKNGMYISSDELSIDFEELEQLIGKYYNDYK